MPINISKIFSLKGEKTKVEKNTNNTKTEKKGGDEMPVFIPVKPQYSLDDIVLPTNVKERLLDAIEFNANSELVFETWGLKKTHKNSRRIGINLYGVSGTGKTMAAHAIAKALNRDILIINYADLESKYVGETPKNIRMAFEAAKKTNSILFFDEADAILSRRVTSMNSANDVSVNQTRSVMLMLMNEFQDYIIFATNYIQNFDSAFMRKIAMHIKFELPDESCRKQLWRMYIPSEMPNNVDIDEIAAKFDGLSGSDISTAVLNAAFKAVRKKMNIVDKELVYLAVQEIIDARQANSGIIEVKTRKISEEEVIKELCI